MEICTLENGKSINIMEKVLTYTLMESKYIGDWKKDKYYAPDNLRERHGQGTYIYSNGDKYVGEWKKGKRHGKGIFTHVDGKVEEGIWKKGKLIKPNG